MNLTDLDLRLIQEALLRNFDVGTLESSGLLDKRPDKSLRVQLAEIDIEFFCRFYLGKHFSKEPAKMHREFALECQALFQTKGRANQVLAWPRGHAKTTWATLGLPMYAIVFTKRHHILVISDSESQAKGQLATIKDDLEHNERIEEDFGSFRGRKWQEDDIETSNLVKVSALGSGMKIRGRKYMQWRPDLIVVDDPEEIKAVQSDVQREGTWEWFTRSVMRAGWDDTKVVVVGNFIHFNCLTARLAKNPLFKSKVYKAVIHWADREDLWEEWRQILTNLADPAKELTARQYFLSHRREMLQGVETAWPEAYTYYDLMTMRVSEGTSSFAMELQNEPVDPETRLFKKWGKYEKQLRKSAEGIPELWLVPLNGRPSVRLIDCAIFGATDPSLGKNLRSDPSAIVIMAKSPMGQGFVLEVDKRRRPPDQIMLDQNKWGRQYTFSRYGIEAVQFQAFYATQSAKASMEDGTYLPIVPIQQAHRGAKELRIQSLQPDMENEYILVCNRGQENLELELEQAGGGGEDDALDALEMAWRLAQQWDALNSVSTLQSDIHTYGERLTRAEMAVAEKDPWSQWDDLADDTIAAYVRDVSKAPDDEESAEHVEERRWFPVTVL